MRKKNRAPVACQCGDHWFVKTSAWGVALVSPQDRRLLENFTWSLSGSHGGARCVYAATYVAERKGYLHRAVLRKAKRIDHRNGNGLDNRRPNLRRATHAQNLFNRGKNKNNTSGYKGVYWRKSLASWVAILTIDGRAVWLGRHPSAASAGAAYDTAAKQHFGRFARFNFPTAKGAEQ